MGDDGTLNLGHILAASGVSDVNDVVALRHTDTEVLQSYGGITPTSVLAYTRAQRIRGSKLSKQPPRHWLLFLAAGGRRSRFYCAYENRGEVVNERSADMRYFDLQDSGLMSALANRLVIQWPKDAINWAKSGAIAATFPVLEIADPEVVEFPGFDRVFLTHAELQSVIVDSRYVRWRTALTAVQGIYLIADTTDGRLYVGKADGRERILGRWAAYAHDGHGGNLALRDLAGLDPTHARHFVFSILRVFGPAAMADEVNKAEEHYKKALLTKRFGLNG